MNRRPAHGGLKPAVVHPHSFVLKKLLHGSPSPLVRRGVHAIVALTTALALVISPLSMTGTLADGSVAASTSTHSTAVSAPMASVQPATSSRAPAAPSTGAAPASSGTTALAPITASTSNGTTAPAPNANPASNGANVSTSNTNEASSNTIASTSGTSDASSNDANASAPATDTDQPGGGKAINEHPRAEVGARALMKDVTDAVSKDSTDRSTRSSTTKATATANKSASDKDTKAADKETTKDSGGGRVTPSTAKSTATATVAASPVSLGVGSASKTSSAPTTTNAVSPSSSPAAQGSSAPKAKTSATSNASPTAQPSPSATTKSPVSPSASPAAQQSPTVTANASATPAPSASASPSTQSSNTATKTASVSPAPSATPSAASATPVATSSATPESSPVVQSAATNPSTGGPAVSAPPTRTLPCPPNPIAAAALGCSGYSSVTAATSGNIVSQGAVAQTNLNNSQVAGVVTGGGTAPVVVHNVNSAQVNDSGSGIGQSGLANAQNGAPSAVGSSAAPGPVAGSSATSGDASANGVSAQNSLTNTTRAGVVVSGPNNAGVTVTSQNQVAVSDIGAASATSGSAMANTAPSAGSSSSGQRATAAIASATMPGMVHTSAPVSASGLNAINASQAALNTTSDNTPSDALTINHTGVITISNSGSATGTSASTCSGFGCNLPAASLTNGRSVGQGVSIQSQSATQATSGGATAQGLSAQNVVNTQANVSVKINGTNYGIINVVIQTITSIVNWGSAAAQSGAASAVAASPVGSGVAGPAPLPRSATTGSVQTTGATLSNRVGLSSSVSVQTPGDNHNPIVVFVQLITNLANRGIGQAFSGTAQSFGQTSGASTANNSPVGAASGSASATGLQAQNQVDLSSDVSIDIGGSNYAPIDVYVILGTQIDNQGQALAVSGDARALNTTGAGSPSSSSPSAANTSGRAVNTGLVSATSGSGTTAGVVSAINAANAQTSGVSSPSANRAALNSTSYAINTRGLASMVTGSASTGPLPPGSATGQATAPSPRPPREVGGTSGTTKANPGQGGSITLPSPNQGGLPTGGQNGAPGSLVGPGVVNIGLWSALPDPGALPVPYQRVKHTSRIAQVRTAASTVTDSTSVVELLPMPDSVPDMPLQGLHTRPAAPAVATNASAQPMPAAPSVRSAPATAPATSTQESRINPFLVLALILVVVSGLATVAWRRRVPVAAMARSALGSISMWLW